MIFDNQVTSGQIINSTVWNRAWGLNGTAQTLYDMIGSQQSVTQAYSAGSWIRANEEIGTFNGDYAQQTVAFSFMTGTYISSTRAGELSLWSSGFPITASPFASNLRDSLYILRDGYYIVYIEVGVNNSTNNLGHGGGGSEGTEDQPVDMLTVTLEVENSVDNTALFNKETSIQKHSFFRIPNTINSTIANGPQFVQPYFSAFASYFFPLTTGTLLTLKANMNPGISINFTEKIVHASIKAYFIRAT